MSFWTLDNFRDVTGGRWLSKPTAADAAAALRGVCTDSREAGPGIAFFARKGEQTDGHRFLGQASDAGSLLVVVDDEAAALDAGQLRSAVLAVDDTTAALGRLAAAYRQMLRARVIAVTGSVGKTTTKTLIDAVLSTQYPGRASPKSFNNHVGVPLTILSARPGDQYLVVEIGTNAPGEIAALARIAQPDIAVITYIGSAHLEGLGGPDGVLREKASLLSHLRDGGPAIVNGDFPALREYRRAVSSMVTFGRSPDCDLRLTDFAANGHGTTFRVNERNSYHVPLLGEHNAINALAAIAVARHMNLGEPQIARGLSGAAAPHMRLRIERFGPPERPLVLINDSYNANPDSVAAALKVLRQYPAVGRRVAILGDMGELGARAPELHRRIGEAVVESQVDVAVLIGPLSMFTAEAIGRRQPATGVHVFPAWADSTAREVAGLVGCGDTVLLKASRMMGLERVVPAIADRCLAVSAPGGPRP